MSSNRRGFLELRWAFGRQFLLQESRPHLFSVRCPSPVVLSQFPQTLPQMATSQHSLGLCAWHWMSCAQHILSYNSDCESGFAKLSNWLGSSSSSELL